MARVALSAIAAVALSVTLAPSPAGAVVSTINISPNPILATSSTGWQAGAGLDPVRRVATTRPGASYAAAAAVTASSTYFNLPITPATPGDSFDVHVDVKFPVAGVTTKLRIQWQNSASQVLSYSDGATSNPSKGVYSTLTAQGTAPSGAAFARGVITTAHSGTTGSGDIVATLHVVYRDRALSSSPTQPATLAYDSTTGLSAYNQPGALVVAGRTNYNDQAFHDVSAAGGTVLIYLDTIINNDFGPYHSLLFDASACGAAVPNWPGNIQANSYGYLADFRPGSVLQGKLECVLEKMVADNPHMGGWFADDVGSRSYFGGPSGNRDVWNLDIGSAGQQSYRDGAIAITQTFRKVADKHGLIFLVNGSWQGGSTSVYGGGYPTQAQSGNALADGTIAEHHEQSEGPFWFTQYPCAAQWADQSTVTRGTAFNYALALNDSDRAAYASSGCYAFAVTQTNYSNPVAPWTTFHRTGLPSQVLQ